VGIVEALEFEQPRVVSLPMLIQLAVDTGAAENETEAVKSVYWLQELGWLGSVRTKGAWEFIPGSRAGVVGSGDRFLEFRAHLAVCPGWPGVLAMESAATVLGLAQHLPIREVVALPPDVALPKSLADWRRVSAVMPVQGFDRHDYLPTWNLEGLVAGIALRPSGYQDLPSLAQWLPDVGAKLRKDALLACLTSGSESVWQRAAYLARIAGAEEVAVAIMSEHPPRYPIWFGATRSGGVYDAVSKVSDADLSPYLSGGIGA
jgi:hypothetical protein